MKRKRRGKKTTEKSEAMREIEKRVQHELSVADAAEKAKLVTAAELMQEDETPREIYVPALKRKIKVCELQFGDFPELAKLQAEKDPFKIAVKTLLLTWGRADSTVTEEFLARLSLTKATAILEALGLGGRTVPLPKPTQT